ncbi:hypothetical protein EDD18DRAFT_1109268 [Armillaria luteobubalina]|uniref:Uncharacterized protein n=1 Tax=Armillaria luteobubalina TaxID=153913 RepID=A0AA39PZV7_9AGAR|nr:hypothetical protein EDD18DRAFT_1109268 [Armillaria luteobubalina]
MALVQLHPEDAAWKRVAESFMIWEKEPYSYEHHPPRTDDIQVENDNIRYALRGLDDFFDGGAHTRMPSESSLAWLPMDRIRHFSRRCLGRNLEDKRQPVQQV